MGPRRALAALCLLAGACGFSADDPTVPTPAVTTPPTVTVPDAGVPGVLRLRPDGLGVTSFGDSADTAIAAVATVLDAEPDLDTGWIDPFSTYGACPGSEARAVEFGDLVLLFTDADTGFTPAGTRHFFSYTYGAGSRGPDGLITEAGIGIGSTLEEVQTTYGEAFRFNPDNAGPAGPGFDIGFVTGSFTRLYGFFSGPGPDDFVLALNGGVGCAQ